MKIYSAIFQIFLVLAIAENNLKSKKLSKKEMLMTLKSKDPKHCGKKIIEQIKKRHGHRPKCAKARKCRKSISESWTTSEIEKKIIIKQPKNPRHHLHNFHRRVSNSISQSSSKSSFSSSRPSYMSSHSHSHSRPDHKSKSKSWTTIKKKMGGKKKCDKKRSKSPSYTTIKVIRPHKRHHHSRHYLVEEKVESEPTERSILTFKKFVKPKKKCQMEKKMKKCKKTEKKKKCDKKGKGKCEEKDD